MLSRIAWRRTVTAVGIYGSAVFGFLGTVVAAHGLGLHDFGLLAIVLAATGFFQLLLDLTTDDAIVKFGFRYVTARNWGRLRRLLGLALGVKVAGGGLAALGILAVAPFAEDMFQAEGLLGPMLVAALLPVAQAPQGVAAAAMLLRERYDARAVIHAFQMLMRLAALAVGSQYGVVETVVALVAAQVVATSVTGAVGLYALSRFPRVAAAPLAEDAPLVRRFVFNSTIGTGLDSARSMLTPLLLGLVSTPVNVAWFRAAQASYYGFASLSAPVRLILLTEQTRDFERGELKQMLGLLRRYVTGAAALMAGAVPLLWWLMPDLVRLVFPDDFGPATDAARLVLLAAAVQVIFGWAKSLPVSIGRPGLRILANGVEIAVLIPFVLVFGAAWGATGGGAAMAVAAGAFAATWIVLLVRLRRQGVLRAEPASA